MQGVFETKNWLKGFEIKELAQSLRSDVSQSESQTQDLWTDHMAFQHNPTLLKSRLQSEGITVEQLKTLQSSDNTFDTTTLEAEWLKELYNAYNARSGEGSAILEQHNIKLLTAVHRLISWTLDDLIEQYQGQGESVYLIELFLPMLLNKLAKLVNRAVVLEKHIEKHRGQLQGETPEARFAHYIDGFSHQEKQLQFLLEYPLLTKKVLRVLGQWKAYALAFSQQLEQDSEVLCREFHLSRASVDSISQVQGGMGDSHNGGRSVLILTFKQGEKLVYKPRDLAVEVHFFHLLRWLNQRHLSLAFKTLKVVNRHQYGWVEHVENSLCDSEQQLTRYYERVGGLLAVLYMLEAKDIHFENVIAHGEHPVIIDLETLFQGAKNHHDDTGPFQYCVLNTELLPTQLTTQSQQRDISGIAGQEKVSVQGNQWQQTYTDNMHFSQVSLELEHSADNRPSQALNASQVAVLESSLKKGFVQTYQRLTEHKSALLAKDGPIQTFYHEDVRYVLRNTTVYSDFIRDLAHPENLNSSLSEAHRLDYLYLSQPDNDKVHQVIRHEREALKANDVPCFSISVNGKQLESHYGVPVKDYVTDTPFNSVIRRIHGLGERDLHQQWALMDASLKSMARNHGVQKQDLQASEWENTLAAHTDETADTLVYRYLDLMHFSEGKDASWFSIALTHGRWTVGPISNNWFEGQIGVTLFLAYYGNIHHDKCAWELAEKSANYCLTQLITQLMPSQAEQPVIGLFDGIAGMLYMVSHLHSLRPSTEYVDCGATLKTPLKTLIEQDNNLDVISGVVGVLQACLSAWHCFLDDDYLILAVLCGERLLEQAQEHPQGLCWTIPLQDQPLAGYSHGAAGIYHGLTQLYKASAERKYLDAAMAGMRFENSLYRENSGNWRDQRAFFESGDDNQNSFWCHGGAGILLSRLALFDVPALSSEEKKQIKVDTENAINSIVQQGFDFNDSLCHGAMGNLVILKKAATVLPEPHFQARLEQELEHIQQQIHDVDHLKCATPLGALTQGFMLGLSGMGWGSLYLRHGSDLPCLLSLDPPRLSHSRFNAGGDHDVLTQSVTIKKEK